MNLSTILLFFLLGLRHGFDPDHIAIIDGVGMRLSATKPRLVAWSGTLFALGHGSVITAVAVMISLFNHSFHFPEPVWRLLDWVPGLLLIAVGLVNLRSLIVGQKYRPHGFRTFLLPAGLRRSSHPLAIVLMGVLFALVFDSTTQAAAWAYTATSRLSTTVALLLGLAFSTGMILTDTTDSRLLYLLISRSGHTGAAMAYRRKLGWIIVSISLLAGSYKILTLLAPGAELSDGILSTVGIVFFASMLAFYGYIWYTRGKTLKTN
jgi:high-affinity nickel-transport protein